MHGSWSHDGAGGKAGKFALVTGLHVLGTVSMNWTEAERIKRRRGQYLLGGAIVLLGLIYAAMMASAL